MRLTNFSTVEYVTTDPSGNSVSHSVQSNIVTTILARREPRPQFNPFRLHMRPITPSQMRWLFTLWLVLYLF